MSQLERRRSERESRYVLSPIRLVDGPLAPQQVVICIHDIGATGIGLLSRRRLEPGWEFLLPHPSTGAGLLYRVAQCIELSGADREFEIGASLVCAVTPDGPEPENEDLRNRIVDAMLA